ncbi:D-alanyl-D-alanine carboxypeptidase [Planktomarina sp.]|nr:D-alanyl-D-alanine carboxypeptidase [Planktomarina sp.]
MDARTGKVYHSRNADTRLHPASLTKMMTLYIAFQAIERKEISLDTYVTISANAAAEPASKLWLKKGQRIKLRYLIRAASIKSANDAATAIGEAISGSEAAFGKRMTRTARALGMDRTTFKNAHGLTRSGHLSTARDMSILGRHMIYDYPQYYNLFSRRSANARVATVRNTNRRLLNSYRGADGIKTGYTRAAGSNLVASAERGSERIIATMFGGTSSAARNARVVKLLDMGFARAPSTTKLLKPALPNYDFESNTSNKRVTAVTKSLRPETRAIEKTGSSAEITLAQAPSLKTQPDDILRALKVATSRPIDSQVVALATTNITTENLPRARPSTLAFVSTNIPKRQESDQLEILIKGSKTWSINVGNFNTRYQAERILLRTALAETSALDGANRIVTARASGYDAIFKGLTRDSADLACRRLKAQELSCFTISPS